MSNVLTLNGNILTNNGNALTLNASGSGAVAQDENGYLVLSDEAGSGGGSSYTLFASQQYEVSTVSTSTISVGTITANRETPYKTILYIKIRDNAGKRNGYFFGADYFWMQPLAGSQSNDYRLNMCYMTDQSGNVISSSTSQYGIVISSAYHSNNTVTIGVGARYHSSYSGTINGTYTVSVYNLKWPDNISPFE